MDNRIYTIPLIHCDGTVIKYYFDSRLHCELATFISIVFRSHIVIVDNNRVESIMASRQSTCYYVNKNMKLSHKCDILVERDGKHLMTSIELQEKASAKCLTLLYVSFQFFFSPPFCRTIF